MPSPPPSLLLQPLFMGKRWGKVFLGVLWPSCTPIPSQLAQPCLHDPKPSTLCPPLSVQREGKGGGGDDEEWSHELIAC